MRQIDHRSMKSLSYSKHVQPSLNHLHPDCWGGVWAWNWCSFPDINISQRAAFAQFGLDSGATSFLPLPVCFLLFSTISWLQLPASPSHVELNKQSCSPRFPTLPQTASVLVHIRSKAHKLFFPPRNMYLSVHVFLWVAVACTHRHR